jgi:hypothetical protein
MKFLDKLKTCFEGKTIVSVDPAEYCSEALAKFTFSDGTAYRLCATDLGCWIEESKPDNSKYSSFDSIFTDVGHYTYEIQPIFDFNVPLPKVEINDKTLIITTIDNKVFEADINKFTPWEQLVCNHAKGLKLISLAAEAGDMWRSVFTSRNTKCPKKLHLSLDYTGDE